jgi:hypothetical protein
MKEFDFVDIYEWLHDANRALIGGNLSREEVEIILAGDIYLLHHLSNSFEHNVKECIKTHNFTLRAFYLLHRRPKTEKNLELISRLAMDTWFFIEKLLDD